MCTILLLLAVLQCVNKYTMKNMLDSKTALTHNCSWYLNASDQYSDFFTRVH